MASSQQDITIYVRDFSTSPGPRYSTQGESSGEDFYHEVLNSAFANAIQSGNQITINLDGVDGYMSSFLDEAFGNLIYDFGQTNVSKILSIVSEEEPEWIEMIQSSTYQEWEKRRKENKQPTITKPHKIWCRLSGGSLVSVNLDVKECK